MQLGFGGSTFRFACVPGTAKSVADLEGKRIATSYPGVVAKHLAEAGVSAELVKLDGAVETAKLTSSPSAPILDRARPIVRNRPARGNRPASD